MPPQAPLQPLNFQPLTGVAVRVTCVPGAKFALHIDPQLIPAGELVTVPLPVTLTDSATSCTNVADTDCGEFIVTVHPALPLQAPPQPLKLQPLAGVAVRVTGVPAANPAPLAVPCTASSSPTFFTTSVCRKCFRRRKPDRRIRQ